jgi:hypothetical protein
VLRMVSTLGDAFLEDEAGAIHWLDTGGAQLTRIADDAADFDRLRVVADNADTWFAPQLVGDLLDGGSGLGAGQCFSYRIPLTLGGQFAPENFEPCSLRVHFDALGKIQHQIKDLPDGTPITSVKLER